MRTIKIFFNKVILVEKSFVGIGLFFSISLLIINVVLRRMDNPSTWMEEAIRFIMIWLTFVGSAVCFREGSHYGVDLILTIKNLTFQKIISTIVLVTSLIFSIILLKYGVEFMLFAKNANQLSAAMNLPAWLVYLCVPVGSILSIIHIIEVFLYKVLNIGNLEND